jgi:branched-chain amino acid transport system substrate-binding protein
MNRLAFALALCVSLLAGVAASEEGVTEKEIVIGSCSALTGPAKDQGLHQSAGARAYFESVNESGGVNGRKIKLLSYDDQYDPEKAVACFQRLLEEHSFVTGFFTATAPAVQYAKLAESHRVPMFGATSGGAFLYEPFKRYVLNVRPSFLDEAEQLVDHLWNDLKFRKIGVIYQSDVYGAAVLGHITEVLKKRGTAPVALGSFPRLSADPAELDPAIEIVRKAEPQAVVLASLAGSGADIIKRGRKAGWNVMFLNIGARDSLIKGAGPEGDGTVVSQVFPSPDRVDVPLIARYHEIMKKYSPGIDTNYAVEGFVGAVILVEGLKRAGAQPTREKFIEAVESIRGLDIGLGPQNLVNYGPKDHRAFNTCFYAVSRAGQGVALTDWKALKAR